jgi:putative transposase
MEERYEVVFLETGFDDDHADYLVQSIPATSPSKLIQMINGL